MVWEDTDDLRAALDFLIEAFDEVGGPEGSMVGFWENEDPEAFGDIFLGPSSKLGFFGVPGFDEMGKIFGGELKGVRG